MPSWHDHAPFFAPRRTDWESSTPKAHGVFAPDWSDPAPGWKTQVRRYLLPKIKQDSSSPPGMSKLPYELLVTIYQELCGFEIASTRLVCTDWELASRPFFAQQFLRKILLSVSVPQLRVVQRLADKFGPYIENVYISSDRFTILGLRTAIRNYRTYCLSSNFDTRHTAYLSLSAKRRSKAQGCHYWKYCNHLRAMNFFLTWFGYSVSQTWLRVTGLDLRLLSAIAAQLREMTEIQVVNLMYDGQELDRNLRSYGRAASIFPFEMALFNTQTLATCDSMPVTRDIEYELYLRNLLLNIPSSAEGFY